MPAGCRTTKLGLAVAPVACGPALASWACRGSAPRGASRAPMYNAPRLAQRPSALTLDVLTRRADWQQPDDGGAAAAGHVAPRGVSYRQRWRRSKKLVRRPPALGTEQRAARGVRHARSRAASRAQLAACVAAALLLPLLQLAATWHAGRGGGAPAAAASARAPSLPPWKGLPRYVTVLPRRQPEPEPGCLGWRLGGGHATSSEDDADLDAGPSTPLKRDDCYLPLEREPGSRGAARARHAPRRARRRVRAAGCIPRRLTHAARRAGTCICSGTRVDVDLQALRAARGHRKTGAWLERVARRCGVCLAQCAHALSPSLCAQRRRCFAPRCAAKCGRRTRARR